MAPTSSCRSSHRPHQRRGRPPRALRNVRRHRRRVRPLPRPVDGPVVVCADDPVAARPRRRPRRDHLRHRGRCALPGPRPRPPRRGVRFVVDREASLGEVLLPLRGLHNVRNALGAVAMAMELGAPFDGRSRRSPASAVSPAASNSEADGGRHLRRRLRAPAGRDRRRAQRRGRTSGDGWGRIVAVFQPNRFRRMALMSPAYRDAFVDADVVVITDIYPSGEAPIPGVTGKLVVNAVLDAHPRHASCGCPHRDDLVDVPRRRAARRRRVHLDGMRRHRHAARRGPGGPRRARVR